MQDTALSLERSSSFQRMEAYNCAGLLKILKKESSRFLKIDSLRRRKSVRPHVPLDFLANGMSLGLSTDCSSRHAREGGHPGQPVGAFDPWPPLIAGATRGRDGYRLFGSHHYR